MLQEFSAKCLAHPEITSFVVFCGDEILAGKGGQVSDLRDAFVAIDMLGGVIGDQWSGQQLLDATLEGLTETFYLRTLTESPAGVVLGVFCVSRESRPDKLIENVLQEAETEAKKCQETGAASPTPVEGPGLRPAEPDPVPTASEVSNGEAVKPVANVRIERQGHEIRVLWDANGNPKGTRYVVEGYTHIHHPRSYEHTPDWKPLGSTTETSLLHRDAPRDSFLKTQERYYRVRPDATPPVPWEEYHSE